MIVTVSKSDQIFACQLSESGLAHAAMAETYPTSLSCCGSGSYLSFTLCGRVCGFTTFDRPKAKSAWSSACRGAANMSCTHACECCPPWDKQLVCPDFMVSLLSSCCNPQLRYARLPMMTDTLSVESQVRASNCWLDSPAKQLIRTLRFPRSAPRKVGIARCFAESVSSQVSSYPCVLHVHVSH